MPHIILEHSKAIESNVEIPALIAKLHENLAAHGEIPVVRIKARAISISTHIVADKGANGTMAHLTLLLLEGRDTQTRQKYGTALYELLKQEILPHYPECSITLEVREMDKDTYYL